METVREGEEGTVEVGWLEDGVGAASVERVRSEVPSADSVAAASSGF